MTRLNKLFKIKFERGTGKEPLSESYIGNIKLGNLFSKFELKFQKWNCWFLSEKSRIKQTANLYDTRILWTKITIIKLCSRKKPWSPASGIWPLRCPNGPPSVLLYNIKSRLFFLSPTSQKHRIHGVTCGLKRLSTKTKHDCHELLIPYAKFYNNPKMWTKNLLWKFAGVEKRKKSPSLGRLNLKIFLWRLRSQYILTLRDRALSNPFQKRPKTAFVASFLRTSDGAQQFLSK